MYFYNNSFINDKNWQIIPTKLSKQMFALGIDFRYLMLYNGYVRAGRNLNGKSKYR